MGRKTYLSIGKPLPGRTNIVVTRDALSPRRASLVAHEPRAALEAARGDALRRGADDIMVIGGAEIFAQAMPLADRLEITQVHAQPGGRHVFRRSIRRSWREAERSAHPAGPRATTPRSISSSYRQGKRREP